MLGDKVKSFIHFDTRAEGKEVAEALEELNQLIESHEKRVELEGELEEYQIIKEAIENLEKYIPGSTDGHSLSEMINNRIVEEVKLYDQIEKLEKENEQLKEDALLGRAFKWAEENGFRFRNSNDYWDLQGILNAYKLEHQDQTKEEV